MDLKIIIVNWNTIDLLSNCLGTIVSNTLGISYTIVVVDNNSTDGSVDIIRRRFPQVHVIENRQNVGFAQANNKALHHRNTKYVLLLNPDTEVKRSSLETLVRFMDNHPQAGGAGSMLLNIDGTLQTSCYPSLTLSREIWRLFHLDKIRPFGIYDMKLWNRKNPREVDVVQGACLILRWEALDQVGLFDEAFFVYSEEVDLCFRLREAGWQLYWVPAARVVHYGGQSTSQIAEKMFLELYRGKIQFFRKHNGWIRTLIYKLVLVIASLARLALTPFARLERPSKQQRYLTLAEHYRRLLVALPGM